jgi:diacylglycerol kinase (ATP)
MTAKVILNPYAARWQAKARQAEIESALSKAGIDYEMVATKAAEHGIRLAAEAVKAGFDPIIAAGGDGSIGEVVNGMMQAAGEGTPPKLGILPLGTANDLIDNLGMPKELDAAAAVIAEGETRMMDLGEVNGRYFVNNAGIGLEPYVTTLQQRMTYVKGIVRYLLATLTAIGHNPQWEMELEWDGGSYQGPTTLVSIGNFPRTGGIFFTVPHADGFDEKLTFVHGYLATRLGILKVLPKTMKADEGNYVEHAAVHEHHTSWLKVKVKPGSPAHADGELFTKDIEELNYRIHPARLPILTLA